MMASAAAPAARSRSRLQRVGIVVLAIVILLAVAAWVATIVLRPHPPTPASITHAMVAQAGLHGGAQVYATHCAYCHDTGFGPAIAGGALTPDAIKALVRSGPGMMPAFPASQVSDADIVAVTGYLNDVPARAGGVK